MMNKYLLIITLLALTSCSNENKEQDVEQKLAKNSHQESSANLVKVGDKFISESAFERSMYKNLGEFNVAQLDAEGKKKYLESMAVSSAMAQLAEKELNDYELTEISHDVDAYREQLLVKRYLANNITPEPVTSKMVKDYYNEHPEKFGSKKVLDINLISVSDIPDATRADVIKLLSDKNLLSDLGELKRQIKGLELELLEQRQRLSEESQNHYSTAKGLQVGESSKIFFVKGGAQVVILDKQLVTPAKPLSEVSGEIRKMLAPIQLKKAIKKASDEAKKVIKIEYL